MKNSLCLVHIQSMTAEDLNTLKHHGILGQKWGVRRYQNADGTLTTAGRKRYGIAGPEASGRKGVKAKNAARVLNDIEEEISTRRSTILKNRRYLKTNEKRLTKAYEKGNVKKQEKYSKRVALNKAAEAKALKEFQALKNAQKDFADIFSKGYGLNITMKDAVHNTKPLAQKFADSMLFGWAVNAFWDVKLGDVVNATKFKVKQSKTGSGEIKDKRKRASMDDQFDFNRPDKIY